MSNFKTIEKLGLAVHTLSGLTVVSAESLEMLLQSAQVVYGVWDKNGCRFAESQFPGHTHTAMLLNITSIKKKTKAEAALELLERISRHEFHLPNNADLVNYSKKILDMKDEV